MKACFLILAALLMVGCTPPSSTTVNTGESSSSLPSVRISSSSLSTNTPQSSISSADSGTDDWLTFTNTQYNYTLQYPPDMQIGTHFEYGQPASRYVKEPQIVLVHPDAAQAVVSIFAFDTCYNGEEPSRSKDIHELSLQEFAKHIYEKNKITLENNARLEPITLNTLPAFSFSVAKGYEDDCMMESLSLQRTVIITEIHGKKIGILFPTEVALNKAIVDSFRTSN